MNTVQQYRFLVLIFATGICFSFLLPNHYYPWLSFHQEFCAAICGIPLLLWCLVRVTDIPNASIISIALVGVCLLQWVIGIIIYWGDALLVSIYLMGFGAAALVGQSVDSVDSGRDRLSTAMAFALIAAGVVSVGLSAHQVLELNRFEVWVVTSRPHSRAIANLAQANHLHTLLMLSTLSTLWLLWRRTLSTWGAWILIAWFEFGMVWAASRTVYLQLLWLLLFSWWMARKNSDDQTFKTMFKVIALGALIAYFWPIVRAFLFEGDVGESLLERGAGNSVRWIYWQSMIDAIAEKPMLGYGFNQISFAQWDTVLQYPDTQSYFHSAHNLIIDMAVSVGVPATGLLVLWFGVWGLRKILKINSLRDYYCLASIGVIVLHALVEYPQYYAYFLIPLGVWVGVLSNREEEFFSFVQVFTRQKITNFIGVVVFGGVLLFAFVSIEYFSLEKKWEYLRYKEANFFVDSGLEIQSLPYVLTNMRALLSVLENEVEKFPGNEGLENLRNVARRYPLPDVLRKYSMALYLNGNEHEAELVIERLCKMHEKSVCDKSKEALNNFRTSKPMVR